MIKINSIRALRNTKIIFYISLIVLFATGLSVSSISYIYPANPTNGVISHIGSFTSSVIENNYVCNFNMFATSIILYTFLCLSLVSLFVSFWFINYFKDFAFNFKSQRILSIVAIVASLLLFLISSIIVFGSMPEDFFIVKNQEWKIMNFIFEYKFVNYIIDFKYSASGISLLVLLILELFILFYIILHFSYKIIKKKYI